MKERHAPGMLVTAGASRKMSSCGKLRKFNKKGIVWICVISFIKVHHPLVLISFVPFVLCPLSHKILVSNWMFSVTRNGTRVESFLL